MSTSIRMAVITALLLAAVLVGAVGPASARPAGNGPTDRIGKPPACTPLAAKYFDVELDESGDGNIRVADNGIVNCDEAVVLWSLANSSAVIDNHEPIVDQVILQVSDLEAAGKAGIDFSLTLDPCWGGFQVLRDGDSLVHEEMIGDGCDMTIDVNFTGPAAEAEIHVVQQTGTIVPPHFLDATNDQVFHLTGMPSGTWYVKVYEAFTPGSDITVGPVVVATDTVYGVPNGAVVEIDLVTEFGLAVPAGPTGFAMRTVFTG